MRPGFFSRPAAGRGDLPLARESRLSPDGRLLLGFAPREQRIEFDGSHVVTLTPRLVREEDAGGELLDDVKWSRDAAKLFLLVGGSNVPQELIVYDLARRQRTVARLELPGDFYANELLISPTGPRVYIRAHRIDHSGNAYVLDLPGGVVRGTVVRPRLFFEDLRSFDVGPNDTFVFHVVPPAELPSPHPREDAGLYLADRNGAVVARLTRNAEDVTDVYPSFSTDGRGIAFMRMGLKTSDVYVLVRESSGE